MQAVTWAAGTKGLGPDGDREGRQNINQRGPNAGAGDGSEDAPLRKRRTPI